MTRIYDLISLTREEKTWVLGKKGLKKIKSCEKGERRSVWGLNPLPIMGIIGFRDERPEFFPKNTIICVGSDLRWRNVGKEPNGQNKSKRINR